MSKDLEPEWDEIPRTQVRRTTAPPSPLTEPTQDLPVLVVLSGGAQGYRHHLDQDEIVLGRSPDADIQIDSDDASRFHARIFKQNGEVLIEDQGSCNGTSVNNLPIKRQVLMPGDRVRLGNSAVFLFTRQSPLEDKFLEAQKLESIGRLAGGIAHDFNNLMASLLADIDYLKRQQVSPPAETQECLENMDRAARRSVELTGQLLSFTQQGAYLSQVVDVADLVEEVAAFLRHSLSPGITIRTKIEPGLEVVGDRPQLRQMLANLCLNARDAMPEGGQLEIRAKLCPTGSESLPHVQLCVTDTGCGMDASTQSRIFEPYFTTKEVGQGSGLGLAAVYGIVKKHNGKIEVQSTPSRGTSFTLWFAARCPQRVRKVEGGTIAAVPRVACETPLSGDIIVAEDDVALRKDVSAWLAEMGHRVLPARDGHEALMQYLEHRKSVRLVVLDMVMPRLGGKETFRRLRQLDPLLKIMVISGYIDQAAADDLLRDGVSGFLSKPFDAHMLREAIRRALDEGPQPVATMVPTL